MDLGKKTFSQLALGKLGDATISGILDRTINPMIFSSLVMGIHNVQFFLDSVTK